MRSIRFRVAGTYLVIIFITIALFGTGVYSFIRNYYMDNIERNLIKDHGICSDIYSNLYYQYDIETESSKLGAKLLPYTRGQVLLLNEEGFILYDSTDIFYEGTILSKDLQRVLAGEMIIQKDSLETGERIMSVTGMLDSGYSVSGILKLSISLEEVYKVLNRIILILLTGGLAIVAVVSVIAFIIANTITRPIKKVTSHISAISAGDLKERPGGRYKDELSEVTANLNALSLRLSENEKLREEFIESVSHELRTPLTSIKGWIITLKNGKEDDSLIIDEGLEIIDSETDRLTGLVDDLLDFAGYVPNDKMLSYVDISKEIGYVCLQMKPRADRLGINLSHGDRGPLSMWCDKGKIKQVLINLLDNALKYCRTGDSVHISNHVEAGCAVIKVRDTGPGFSQDNIPRIFEKKYQGGNAMDGKGLGLAIAKEIIAAHDGTISVSTSDKGTTVLIRLPVKGGR